MSTPNRRGMLDPADERVSIRRQCDLVGVARSGSIAPQCQPATPISP